MVVSLAQCSISLPAPHPKVTAETRLIGNVHFNGPRAGMNFNDGFGGGDVIDGNVIGNCVRESGDHGPYNSWDRVPYITTLRTGPAVHHTESKDTSPGICGSAPTAHRRVWTQTMAPRTFLQDFNVFAYGMNGLKK